MLGQRVNNFEIVRLLGEGGMGAVYEATHLVIRRRVAVKVLRPELALDGELVQRFFNEARATSAIRHPNIVEVVDVGMLPDGIPFLVMELLEGESLADRLERMGQLDLSMAVDFVRQAASALDAAHAAGIVHRDLKPENLFLVPDQRFADRELVKVLDFGIAKLLVDLSVTPVHTVAGALYGTPPYMSPEQCRAAPSELDHRTDIYALGIILYEALCGQRPFAADGIANLMMLHMNQIPRPPSQLRADLSPHLERVILKALEKRREDRFSSMAEFAAALDASLLPAALLESVAAEPIAALAGDLEYELEHSRVTLRHAAAQDTQLAAASRTDAQRGAKPVRTAVAFAILGAALVTWFMLSGVQHAPGPRVSAIAIKDVAPRTPPSAYAAEPSAPALPLAIEPAEMPAEVPAEVPEVAAPAVAVEERIEEVPVRRDRDSDSIGKHRVERRARAERKPAAVPDPAPAVNEPAPAIAAAADVIPQPAEPAAEPGYLSLDSAPWSDVFLGPKLLGTTPLIRVPLPAGKHLLTLKNSELGTSTSYAVEIKAGKTLSRLVGWEKVK